MDGWLAFAILAGVIVAVIVAGVWYLIGHPLIK